MKSKLYSAVCFVPIHTTALGPHLVGVASAAEPDRISELSSDRVAERPKAEREQISARPSSCSCWGRIPDSSGRRGFETLPRSDDSLPAIPPPPEPHLVGLDDACEAVRQWVKDEPYDHPRASWNERLEHCLAAIRSELSGEEEPR